MLHLESLEDRVVPSIGPVTPWHFAPADNFARGSYNAPGDPGSAGFNLVAIYDPSQLAKIPPGYKAIVDMGPMTHGVDAHFLQSIQPYIGDPRVFAFYLVDEPNPTVVSPAALKAEADWIHANDPGAKAFMVMGPGPLFLTYTPANTDMDLVGLDPYPIRSWGINYWYIPEAVLAAEMVGWSNSQIVPVYQSFGGAGSFDLPTAAEEQMIIALWGMVTPTPAFDYAYSWGDWGATGMVDDPALQAVLQDHNAHATNLLAWLESMEAMVIQRMEAVGHVGVGTP